MILDEPEPIGDAAYLLERTAECPEQIYKDSRERWAESRGGNDLPSHVGNCHIIWLHGDQFYVIVVLMALLKNIPFFCWFFASTPGFPGQL